jgi:tetratricopeptide (TPR) repeat protein
MRKEFEAAEGAYELARELFAEIGHATLLSYSLSRMADVAFETGDLKRSEKFLRESIRLLAPLGQHRELAESQAELGRVLAEQGKTDEAERFVGEAQEYLPSAEPQLRLWIVLGLAAVRIAQERQDEAEELFLEALAISDEVDFTAFEVEVLRRIIRFLEDAGQNGKASPYEERLAALVPAESTAEIA